ncbi:MAG TPA: hypothetical protein PK289_01955 [Bacteroidia bacterium]|jgi:hypothetical protein|nr:hypothetical protein [Bacteroidia bacterium]HRG52994.1 hypothetical protein [Bacteroidia bacterium]
MKNFFVIPLLFSVVLITQCASPKELSYELPEAMIPTAKVGFAAQCDKGKILYDMTCAKCHNIKTKRKEIIPDFSEEQLVGYELRITNAEHESGISEELLSTEELGYIMTFLSYKKKSGTVFVSKVAKSDKPHNH